MIFCRTLQQSINEAQDQGQLFGFQIIVNSLRVVLYPTSNNNQSFVWNDEAPDKTTSDKDAATANWFKFQVVLLTYSKKLPKLCFE